MFSAMSFFSCILIYCFIRVYIWIFNNNILCTKFIKKPIDSCCIYTDFFFFKMLFYISGTYCSGTIFMISGTSLLLYHYKLFYSDSPLTSMLLFNSLSELQTKPLPPIRHICDFSRGALNVRSTHSHPTLAPRPQICLIGGQWLLCCGWRRWIK